MSGKYESELHKALLLLQDIARDDTNASAKAGGFVAGVRERLGWRVRLSRIEAECWWCGDQVRTLRDGRVAYHFPRDPRFAYYEREGYYCRGSGAHGSRADEQFLMDALAALSLPVSTPNSQKEETAA